MMTSETSRSWGPSLCEQCRNIDIQQVFNTPLEALKSSKPKVLARLDDLESSPGNGCPLCVVFLAAKESHGLERNPQRSRPYYVCVMSCPIHFIWSRQYRSDRRPDFSRCLTVTDTLADHQIFVRFSGQHDILDRQSRGYLMLSQPSHDPASIIRPRIVEPLVDFRRVRHWLTYCSDHHGGTCQRYIERPLLDLTLIDCKLMQLIRGSNRYSYLALSYVWGQNNQPRSKEISPTAMSLPRTIEDAIQVTQELGFRFLWVDQLCIDQANHAEKHRQIAQMDAIYAQAELTIIAACGENASSGLAGARIQRDPHRQPAFTSLEVSLVHTLPPVKKTIERSWWATRGWTFQEAMLSRRQLVFTIDTVHFECANLNISEVMDCNLDDIHVKNKSEMLDQFRDPIFLDRPRIKLHRANGSKMMAMYCDLVHQYSERHLSYEADVLRAFSGIMNTLTVGNRANLRQIFGIPFLAHPNDPKASFLQKLLWNPRDAKSFLGRSTSCYWFPSWSWAGHIGSIAFQTVKQHFSTDKATVAMLSGGTCVDITQFSRDYSSAEVHVKPIPLVLKALVVDKVEGDTVLKNWYARLEDELHMLFDRQSVMPSDAAIKFELGKFILVVIGMSEASGSSMSLGLGYEVEKCMHCLIVELAGKYVRRVGTAEWRLFRDKSAHPQMCHRTLLLL